MTTAAHEVRTPTVGRALRRALFWVLAVVLVAVVALVLVLIGRGGQNADADLDPDSYAPSGARAVAEVLRQQGVDVTVTRTLAATLDALDTAGARGDAATVLLHEPDAILDPAQHAELAAAGDDLVLLEPGFGALADLAPGVAAAGSIDVDTTATCGIPAVGRAERVVADGAGYTLTGEASAEAIACLPDGDASGLVRLTVDGRTTTVLGASSILTNDGATLAGNAALGLGLLGERPALIWYLPSSDDIRAAGDAPTLAELTPGWVTPLVVLFAVTAVAAIAWRGRRMGRLVVEDLPVLVRSRETMEGRARLYERGSARLHALDQLRVGAVARLARTAGLPRTATVAEITDAVASLTGRPRDEVAGILVDRVPGSDAELVALSDALAALERDAAARAHP